LGSTSSWSNARIERDAAVIELGYVTARWQTSDVIFINKLGKTDFENPRSFRPISLMSFVYKIHEKVVAMDLEQNAFKENPMHEDQFGFVKGIEIN
jgi:hypothetical protein